MTQLIEGYTRHFLTNNLNFRSSLEIVFFRDENIANIPI